jgi:flagellar L-ring protein precursor FlgH
MRAAPHLTMLACLVLPGCATNAPGKADLVQPAAFPIDVLPQQADRDGSVFPAGTSGSLYQPRRDWRTGDLVTIDIVTSTSAANADISTSLDQEYAGTGTAAASNNVSGQVEAVITHVDPNGTLALAGRTNVNINGNVTSIIVTGYASPDDIAANTTISSNNVADMNVQYVGNGPINTAHQVPWLQQALTKVWPF